MVRDLSDYDWWEPVGIFASLDEAIAAGREHGGHEWDVVCLVVGERGEGEWAYSPAVPWRYVSPEERRAFVPSMASAAFQGFG